MSHAHEHPVADASVRVATPWDTEGVGVVQAAVWRETYASLLSADALAGATPEEFAAAWSASLAHPPSRAYRLLVACAGEDVVGFAALGPSTDPDATIDVHSGLPKLREGWIAGREPVNGAVTQLAYARAGVRGDGAQHVGGRF